MGRFMNRPFGTASVLLIADKPPSGLVENPVTISKTPLVDDNLNP